MQFDFLCVLLASDAQVPPPWPAVALASRVDWRHNFGEPAGLLDADGALDADQVGRLQYRTMQLAFSVAGAQESPAPGWRSGACLRASTR
jgi:hypothetical protein